MSFSIKRNTICSYIADFNLCFLPFGRSDGLFAGFVRPQCYTFRSIGCQLIIICIDCTQIHRSGGSCSCQVIQNLYLTNFCGHCCIYQFSSTCNCFRFDFNIISRDYFIVPCVFCTECVCFICRKGSFQIQAIFQCNSKVVNTTIHFSFGSTCQWFCSFILFDLRDNKISFILRIHQIDLIFAISKVRTYRINQRIQHAGISY